MLELRLVSVGPDRVETELGRMRILHGERPTGATRDFLVDFAGLAPRHHETARIVGWDPSRNPWELAAMAMQATAGWTL